MNCYTLPAPSFLIFAEGVPLLLYYSHLPAIAVALLVGTFVLLHNPHGLLNRLLFGMAALFSLWALANLVLWTNVNSDVVMFVWSFFGILSASLSLCTVYLVYAFLRNRDITFWHKTLFAILLLPVIVFAPTSYNLSGFNLELCGSSGFEGIWYLGYVTALGVLGMLWTLALLIRGYFATKEKIMRKEIVLMGVGVEFFLFAFFFTGFLASYLNDTGIVNDYSLEFYGLFGMTFFMVMLSYMIVRFRAFNVGMLGTQALVLALVILIGSLFTFINDVAPRILIGITLILTSAVGIILIKSVRKEIRQRIRIEQLARDLSTANEQQVTLIHFITHQVKGFVTKSRNIFSMIKEGEVGPIPETMKPMIEEGFRSDTQGVSTIQEILNAANIRSGKVSYAMEPFDLAALVKEIAVSLRPAVVEKNLIYTTDIVNTLTYTGDRAQLQNALKNLIENSIKYTLKGSVTVSLRQKDQKIIFSVEDTGVGITLEDMKRLFTEGGHGAESVKVNVESTGFGLYIVKSIIEAHKGKVWAESEGKDKGSRFIVELPA